MLANSFSPSLSRESPFLTFLAISDRLLGFPFDTLAGHPVFPVPTGGKSPFPRHPFLTKDIIRCFARFTNFTSLFPRDGSWLGRVFFLAPRFSPPFSWETIFRVLLTSQCCKPFPPQHGYAVLFYASPPLFLVNRNLSRMVLLRATFSSTSKTFFLSVRQGPLPSLRAVLSLPGK